VVDHRQHHNVCWNSGDYCGDHRLDRAVARLAAGTGDLLCSWLAGLLLTAFMGPAVSSTVGYMLGNASVLCSGLILGLIYFSDLRHAFENEKTIQPIDET
jgi:hypothetical protein